MLAAGAGMRAAAGRTIAVLVASVLAVGCGGHEQKGQRVATTKAARAAPVIVGSGRLVTIGGGRSLFLDCVGSGSPTVVLEAGFAGDSSNWREVHPQLGRTTRTCAYDRAGLGNSVALPGVHDARDEINDLQRLLQSARIAPPYVLVGHSYGGLLVRLFAKAHPGEIAGVVLVDAMGRDQTRRQLALWPKSEEPALRREVARPVRDGVDLASGEALAAHVRSLGDTPVAVITAGAHDDEWGSAPPGLAAPGAAMADDAGRACCSVQRPRARHRSAQRSLRAGHRRTTARRHRRHSRGRLAPPTAAPPFRRAPVSSVAPTFAAAVAGSDEVRAPRPRPVFR